MCLRSRIIVFLSSGIMVRLYISGMASYGPSPIELEVSVPN